MSSIRFDNPFRDEVLKTGAEDSCIKATLTKLSPAKETLTRRDSQQSDSTLPDSEHTDRPQSSSLQSSSLHSDEESVPESGLTFQLYFSAILSLLWSTG